MPTANRAALAAAALVIAAAGLFEWAMVSPDHPVHALLRVLGAALAATIFAVPFRKA